jgi:hypothetical protein
MSPSFHRRLSDNAPDSERLVEWKANRKPQNNFTAYI